MELKKVSIVQTDSLNPYYNLALERALMDICQPDEIILYLWQNQRTVVIGKNQNYFKECQLDVLEADGGHLARRMSGGGAVFHDTGNLNFTFIVPKPFFNISKQLDVIIMAVSDYGIIAEKSGRNDVIADGDKKFSGNAFLTAGEIWYHHGTVLIDVDTENMKKYLTPSKLKLQSKGVESVRSRVVNLTELNSGITVDKMKSSMVKAMGDVYGLELSREDIMARVDETALRLYENEFESDSWRLGNQEAMEFECATRYEWGEVQVHIGVRKNKINNIRIYSDSMETEWCQQKENHYRENLIGMEFTRGALCDNVSEDVLGDLDKYIEENTNDEV